MRRGRSMTFGPKGKLYIFKLGAARGAAETLSFLLMAEFRIEPR
jgi:hypothetical protein